MQVLKIRIQLCQKVVFCTVKKTKKQQNHNIKKTYRNVTLNYTKYYFRRNLIEFQTNLVKNEAI